MTAILAFLKIGIGWLWSALKALPWWAWLVIGLLFAGWLYGERRHAHGAAEVQGRWDAAATIEAQQRRDTEAKQDKVTTKTVIEYVDRVRTIRVKGDTIIKEVVKYVPLDTPDLPPGFRVLHDAAAANELPDASRIATSEPVSAQVATETVAGNYTACHVELEKLAKLWNWAEDQSRLTQ
jgi:hypothetical protein